MKYIFALIVFVTTVFSFAFGSFEDPIVSTETQEIKYQLLTRVERDNGYYAALKNVEDRKVYLKPIDKNCFNKIEKAHFKSYVITVKKWVTKNGKKGYALVDEKQQLCGNTSNQLTHI